MKLYSIFASIIIYIFFSLNSFAGDVTLTKNDFESAQTSKYTVVFAELSPSGKRKVKSLESGQAIEIKVAGSVANVVLKAKLKDKIQFGPFADETAKKIVESINN